MRKTCPAAIQRAASAATPVSTAMPAWRRLAKPLPQISGLGSAMAQTRRRMPAALIASAHGGPRPWCEHGSKVTYMVLPRALPPARSSACASACGRPPGWVQPRAINSSLASSTMTAPTEGLGAVVPSTRRARARAKAILRRSSELPPAVFVCTGVSQVSVLPLRLLGGLLVHRRRFGLVRALDFAQHLLEVRRLAKIAVHRGKAHIGHRIEPLQRLHHQFADDG